MAPKKFTRRVSTSKLTDKQRGIVSQDFAGGGRQAAKEAGVPGAQRTFREVSERDEESRRIAINKFRAARIARGSREKLLGAEEHLPVGIPRGSFAALSDKDKAKLVTAEEFYGDIKKVPPSQVGQFFTREDLEAKREGEDIDIAQIIEDRAKREETREGNIRGDLPLTEEERAGLSGEEIAQFEDPEITAGGAAEVTAGDVLAATGVGGLVKGAVGKVAVKPIANAKGIKDYFKFMSKGKKEQNIKDLANKYGMEEEKVRKAITGREFNKDITKIIGNKNFVKSFGKEAFNFGKVWLPAFAGTDVIINWWAMDNVADGLGFALSNYNEGLTKGTLTQEEAIEILDEAEATYDMALAKLNSATYYNPLMYPARKFIRAGMETKRKIYDIKVANLGIR